MRISFDVAANYRREQGDLANSKLSIARLEAQLYRKSDFKISWSISSHAKLNI